ncbi:hypothetical protein GCM10010430_73150 [Kitasatospora cystarginea]|uniref:Uncharacterized protein n=1 Tax=Kitasatospora cystarginea TaxID=58350 RepID=A0ABN3EYN9_9ACTN
MPKKAVRLHASAVRAMCRRGAAAAAAGVVGRGRWTRACGAIPAAASTAGTTARPIASCQDPPDAWATGATRAATIAEPTPIDSA